MYPSQLPRILLCVDVVNNNVNKSLYLMVTGWPALMSCRFSCFHFAEWKRVIMACFIIIVDVVYVSLSVGVLYCRHRLLTNLQLLTLSLFSDILQSSKNLIYIYTICHSRPFYRRWLLDYLHICLIFWSFMITIFSFDTVICLVALAHCDIIVLQ